MKKTILSIALLLAISWQASAQKTDSTMSRPGQVSFFYPLGTNGIDSPKYSNNVSFNVLYGINGGVHGVEFGGLVNTNLGDVTGAQFAGIANINTKKTNGIICAGIANIVKDTSNSVSFAGITNLYGKSAVGLHFAGIANTVNGSLIGAQFGGIVNTTNGNVIGAQFAGISNTVNGNFTGMQAAGISNVVTGDVIGAQMGLINHGKKIKGFQLGLINVAEEFEKGVPFGLISFVKNGYHAIEISGGEAIYANLNYKMGVDQLYTIYKVGYTANGSENYLTYGLGFGSMLSITEKVKLSLDLSANHILQQSFSPRLNILSRADAAFRFHLTDHIGIFAGPSFNVYVSEFNLDSENTALNVPYTLFEENWWNNEGSTSIWVGANAGVSIRF
ncbi:MAG: hypothetical protein GQ574_15530 [Crocinitomix sp.]|nr:hypothetical protein [Crocinitomix sp.]